MLINPSHEASSSRSARTQAGPHRSPALLLEPTCRTPPVPDRDHHHPPSQYSRQAATSFRCCPGASRRTRENDLACRLLALRGAPARTSTAHGGAPAPWQLVRLPPGVLLVLRLLPEVPPSMRSRVVLSQRRLRLHSPVRTPGRSRIRLAGLRLSLIHI